MRRKFCFLELLGNTFTHMKEKTVTCHAFEIWHGITMHQAPDCEEHPFVPKILDNRFASTRFIGRWNIINSFSLEKQASRLWLDHCGPQKAHFLIHENKSGQNRQNPTMPFSFMSINL
ncbi:hypothetical protein V6N13_051773 [Hibiscus sabdariffa]|uniref:Uncharacterized protein n=1 Tax=Hibiscus sabdariffa TaxID=183260 RepID=A0ABR2T4G8_9ROSI